MVASSDSSIMKLNIENRDCIFRLQTPRLVFGNCWEIAHDDDETVLHNFLRLHVLYSSSLPVTFGTMVLPQWSPNSSVSTLEFNLLCIYVLPKENLS